MPFSFSSDDSSCGVKDWNAISMRLPSRSSFIVEDFV
jgi:hypothetical protein